MSLDNFESHYSHEGTIVPRLPPVSLRDRLRAPLISAVAAALIGGLLALLPRRRGGARARSPAVTSAAAGTKAALLAREQRPAKTDGLTRSRAVFARSSYLCVGYQACSQAGMGAAGYAAANNKMYWRMYAGHNCTNYAAYRMVSSGLPNTRPWSGGGNATYWGTSVPLAHRQGARGRRGRLVEGQHRPGRLRRPRRVRRAGRLRRPRSSSPRTAGAATSPGPSSPGRAATGRAASSTSTTSSWSTRPHPTVAGIAKVGATLTATAGTWKPDRRQGRLPVVRRRRRRSRAPPSRRSPLTSARLGQTITVTTTATKARLPDQGGHLGRRPRRSCPALIASTAPAVLSGVAQVDQTLTARPRAPGTSTPDAPAVQWYADGQPIAGAHRHHARRSPRTWPAA